MTALAVEPGSPARSPKLRRSSVLGALAVALFVASLWLTTLQMFPKAGSDGVYFVDLDGLAAIVMGAIAGAGSIHDAVIEHKGLLASDLAYMVVGSSTLFNVMFLWPLTWLRRSRTRAPSRRVAIAWGIGAALAVATPLALVSEGMGDSLRVGVAVWLAAWVALGAALWAARREAVTP